VANFDYYDPFGLVKELFPIHRTIAGPGITQSLKILQKHVPQLKIREVRSGKRIWDWTVPKEWTIDSGWIEDLQGRKIVDYTETNLRVMGHSIPMDSIISHSELLKHLFFLEEQPDAIPYVTSYYSPNWGFCIRHNELPKFNSDKYRVVINSSFDKGHLRYGEIVIPGKTKQEILFSTNICHPSMANNELSGPAVLVGLIKHLQKEKDLKHTYRFVFIPETIGAIAFLSKNLRKLKRNCIAGLVATCLGDNGKFSHVPSRQGNSLSDKAARYILKNQDANYYDWNDRGSDERQYCWPTINLPISSITRSKYREYPEYHTSLDDLDFINGSNLTESISIYIQFCRLLEVNKIYKVRNLGEPQLSKRNLYSSISKVGSTTSGVKYLDLMNLMDGSRDLIDIATELDKPMDEIEANTNLLLELKLIREAK
jgi:aminopeptidase-like protein